jgi:cellulose synthase operon protein C
MAELAKVPEDVFDAFLDSIPAVEVAEPDAERQRLREYVVLSSSFDIRALPAADCTIQDVDAFLLEDCERVLTRSGQRWRLRAPVRIDTLESLANLRRLQEVISSVDPADSAARMAAMYLAGAAPPLTEQTVEELEGTALAVEWLVGLVATPSAEEARAQLAIETMLAPLRILVAAGFVGRRSELKLLADFVDKPAPTSSRTVASSGSQPPLVIYGPGGVGKSTLIARFMLDIVDSRRQERLPFAYLSFDRSELNYRQPLTLLAEAVLQLGALFPNVREAAEVLARTIRTSLASAEATATPTYWSDASALC